MNKLKICIISEYALPLFNESGQGSGGAELQMYSLAKGLLNKGYDVNFIVFGETKEEKINLDELNLYIPYKSAKNGYYHFNPFNLYKLFKILRQIDADIYIQRAATPLTGLVSLFSKINHKKFIFSASSDANVSSSLKINKITDLVKIPYIYGVKNSDWVICQTNYQKELFDKFTPNHSEVIKNMFNQFKIQNRQLSEKTVLWVGRLIKGKLAEKYLKLAIELPEYEFKMICSVYSENYYAEIKNKASNINNLDFVGYVQNYKIIDYYKNASVFINTSPSEGFPNTFLEAWSSGTPVCSLNFDPDHVIKNFELGLIAESFEDLIKKTKILLLDNNLRNKYSENGIKYIIQNHNPDKIIDQYIDLFDWLTNDNKS